MKIRKGDMVKIISGNDKGKTGRIIKVFLSKDRILVEGVNIVKKHSRPSQENPQGAILDNSMPNDFLPPPEIQNQNKSQVPLFQQLETINEQKSNELIYRNNSWW